MRKNIKYSVPSIIIILLLIIGFVARAEENTTTITEQPVACTMDAKLCPDGVTYVGRIGPKCEFQACPGEKNREGIKNKFEEVKKQIEIKKSENKNLRENFKTEVKGLKDELQTQREENKAKIDALIESVKIQREEFKKEIEIKKSEVKLKIEGMKTTFKEGLKKIKDENKKISAEKIVDIINNQNTILTDRLSERIDQIDNVLVSIKSRISKANEKGIDVSSLDASVKKAEDAIASAREAITAQTGKTYTTTVTDEATLKSVMKTLRDTFKNDIKGVHEKVKLAHQAVKDTAVTLSQIPKIDEDSIPTKVEETNSNNN